METRVDFDFVTDIVEYLVFIWWNDIKVQNQVINVICALKYKLEFTGILNNYVFYLVAIFDNFLSLHQYFHILPVFHIH